MCFPRTMHEREMEAMRNRAAGLPDDGRAPMMHGMPPEAMSNVHAETMRGMDRNMHPDAMRGGMNGNMHPDARRGMNNMHPDAMRGGMHPDSMRGMNNMHPDAMRGGMHPDTMRGMNNMNPEAMRGMAPDAMNPNNMNFPASMNPEERLKVSSNRDPGTKT